MGTVSVRPISSKKDIRLFLEFPYELYRDEPNWVPPLRFEQAARIDRRKNPGLHGIEFQLFLAEQDGEVVGRIAAIINQNHLAKHQDGAGHFGFFDARPGQEIASALFGEAEAWLKARNMDKIVGPYSLSIYEEVGLLIDGFDTPPVVMMPHGRVDYQQTIENLGFTKAIDMTAWWANMHEGYPRPPVVDRMLAHIDKTPEIRVRPMRKGKFLEEVRLAMEIFNDAWNENWGHVNLSDAQIKHMAGELKPLINRDFFWVCEYEGKPAAFILMIPNVNEAIHDLDGKLLPFGWAKLLWRLKVKGLKTTRIPLMGVRKEYQRTRNGLAMAAFLSEKAFEMGRAHGYECVEMGWILETNKSMIRIIEQAQGVAYKTYRMYEKPLA